MPLGVRLGVVATVLAAVALPGVATADEPNDPLFSEQWALARESTLGRAGAWEQSLGRGAVVAVLDSGIDMTHPDLAGALWTNPGEIPGNGVDDDHDGFVDDVHGADLVNHDGDPADDNGHGTTTAGIIAARAGNGIGGAGLAPEAEIMPVKVLDANADGTNAVLAQGIRYALQHGARIINISVNADQASGDVHDALGAADAAGALVVASAGNDGRNIDTRPSYPASYTAPAVVAVGATGYSGWLSPFSDRGAGSVDLAAPGEDILTTTADGDYDTRSGTSMAAPFVAATLALMSSARPDLPGPALKTALLSTAAATSELGGLVGFGALDAAAAVRAASGAVAPPDALSLGVRARRRQRRHASLTLALAGDRAAVASVHVWIDGRLVAQRPAVARSRVRLRTRLGLHRWRVAAVDASGLSLAAADGRLRVIR